MSFFFFFQAEDGIRDKLVTGVQTCALPISLARAPGSPAWLQGLRTLWSPLLASRDGRGVPRPAAAFDSLVSFLDVGGLNLLAGDAGPPGPHTPRGAPPRTGEHTSEIP